METTKINILLADDDHDDCAFFVEALKEIPVDAHFTAVHDGMQLMETLQSARSLPDVVFLDLNMPLKNGFECLSEIMTNDRLKNLPVIILSTSYDFKEVDRVYEGGAHYYIRKPSQFMQLKKVIQQGLAIVENNDVKQPKRQDFVLSDF